MQTIHCKNWSIRVLKKYALLKKTKNSLNANIFLLFGFKIKQRKWNSIFTITSLSMHFFQQHWLKEVIKGKNGLMQRSNHTYIYSWEVFFPQTNYPVLPKFHSFCTHRPTSSISHVSIIQSKLILFNIPKKKQIIFHHQLLQNPLSCPMSYSLTSYPITEGESPT